MGDTVLIEAEDLGRRFDGRVALEALSLTLRAGQVLALLGPNGAGKTTSMRMLAGLLAPSTGRARVCGHPLALDERGNDAIRAVCGVLPEAPGFYERLSARDNLLFFGGLHGIARAELAPRVDAELARFGLADRAADRAGTYSKGMKQRLSLARALLHRPRVLFLDEPTAGLDPHATADLHARVRELRDAGTGIVLSTHNLEEAEQLADAVLMLDTRPVAYGPPGGDAAAPAAIRVDLATPLPAAFELPPACRLVDRGDDRLVVEVVSATRDVPPLVAALVHAGAAVLGVAPVHRGLRERYLDLVGRR